MPIANRVKNLGPSSTLQITALAKKLVSEGIDVVSFGAGEPDFDTPSFIKDAGIEAIVKGFTKYTSSTGILELKKAIQEKFKKENNLDYSLDQIVVSSGAKHALVNIVLAVVDKGDEVIIPIPYWVSYPEMVKLAEGSVKFVQTDVLNDFKLTALEFKKAVTAKTRLLILNSPSNPVGVIYSREELFALAEACVEHNIYVISDEIYEKIIYDGQKHISIAAISEKIRDLTFTVNGVSKAYSMTGWRIGYFAGPREVVSAVGNLQDHSTSNPSSISQAAALKALLTPDNWTKDMRAEFEKRRDYLIARVEKISGLSYIRPQGAFYLFCNIKKFGLKSQDFAMRLLSEAKVAVIPGEGFGLDEYIRLSFCVNTDIIKKGIDRLEEWLLTLA